MNIFNNVVVCFNFLTTTLFFNLINLHTSEPHIFLWNIINYLNVINSANLFFFIISFNLDFSKFVIIKIKGLTIIKPNKWRMLQNGHFLFHLSRKYSSYITQLNSLYSCQLCINSTVWVYMSWQEYGVDCSVHHDRNNSYLFIRISFHQ